MHAPEHKVKHLMALIDEEHEDSPAETDETAYPEEEIDELSEDDEITHGEACFLSGYRRS